MADLEGGRIKELREQQQQTQKKSFTKWINNHLAASSQEVQDLFEDLKDGRVLRTLLEIISGDRLPKLNKGNSKVHFVSNVSVSFDFLKKHNIRLVGIGPEDIVDGIPDLVLGFVWSVIQKYHITAIEIVLDSDEKKYAKEALLLWSQRRTEGYPHVKITDFSSSWKDGMAFLALIHAHRPDLIEYRHFKPADRAFNLETAFKVAEKNLGIARILDVEDMDKERPDEKSVMTYLAYYFHYFSQLDHTKRRSKKLNSAVGIERLKYTYEGKVTLLLQWMRENQASLRDRQFPNTLHGVQELWENLVRFRQHEVKFRTMEYNEVIALIHSVDGRINELNNRVHNPAQSQLMPDLLQEWRSLELEITSREAALKRELERQECLERLANAFRRKVFMREEILKDPEEWVNQDGDRTDFSSAAVIHRLQTLFSLAAELQAKKALFVKLTEAAEELRDRNYHLGEDFCEVANDITCRYNKVVSTIVSLVKEAEVHPQIAKHLSRLDAFEDELQKIKTSLGSIKLDDDEMSVKTGLEITAHLKTNIASIKKSFNEVVQNGSSFQKLDDPTAKFFIKRLRNFHKVFKDTAEARKAMQEKLGVVLLVAKLQENLRALNNWMDDKKKCVLRRKVVVTDYGALVAVKNALELAQKEHASKGQLVEAVQKQLEALRPKDTSSSTEGFSAIEKEVKISTARFARMQTALAAQEKRLDKLVKSDEFLDELDDADEWLTERLTAPSSDPKKTVADVAMQLHRLDRLDGELVSFKRRLDALRRTATGLLDVSPRRKESEASSSSSSSSSESSSEDDEEEKDYEEKTCKVVKALYPYNKKGITVRKGEELILMSTNDRWSTVKKLSGEEGFVPSSYVKESGTTVVRIKSPQKKKPAYDPNALSIQLLNLDLNDKISEKLQHVEDAFTQLQQKALEDREELEEANKFLTFMETCEKFRAWIKQQERSVQAALNDKNNSEGSIRTLNEYMVRVVAGETQMSAITEMAKELVEQSAKDLEKIEKTYQDTAVEWNKLIGLKKKREDKLEDSSMNSEFGAQCRELEDWMRKIKDLLQGKKYGETLNETNDLIPENERILSEVGLMKKTLDDARDNVGSDGEREHALKDLRKQWKSLKKELEERKDRLEATRKIHSYMKDLQNFLDDLLLTQREVDALTGDNNLKEALKKHRELGDVLDKLKRKIKRKELLNDDVTDGHHLDAALKIKAREVKDAQEKLKKSWDDKGNFLKDLSSLKDLEQAMNNMAVVIKKNNKILDRLNLESVVDLKCSKFELVALEEELDLEHKNFSKMDDALHDLQHLDSDRLLPAKKKRRKLEDDFRQLLLRLSESKENVETLLAKATFLEQAANFIQWIAAKMTKVKVPVSVDDDDLEFHLKKHRNLELEIDSGRKHYDALVKTGEQLHEKSKDSDVSKALKEIKLCWKNLQEASAEKLVILDQANAYSTFCSKVNGINYQFRKISSAVEDNGKDGDFDELRKREIEHRRALQNLKFVEKKIEEANSMGGKLVEAKHSAAASIEDQLKAINEMHDKLQKAVEQRGVELAFKLEVAQLLLDVQHTADWVAAQSKLLGRDEDVNEDIEEAIGRIRDLSDVTLDMSIKKRGLDSIVRRGDSFYQKGVVRVKPRIDDLVVSWNALEKDLEKEQEFWRMALGLRRSMAEIASTLAWVRAMKTYLETIDFAENIESLSETEEQLQLLAVKMKDRHRVLEGAAEIAAALQPARRPLLSRFKKALEEIELEWKQLEEMSEEAMKKLSVLNQLQYFLAEANAVLANNKERGRRAFCSSAHLENLVGIADSLLQLGLSTRVRQDVQCKRDLLAEKLGRRRLRGSSRSSSSSSDSSSDEEEQDDDIDGTMKPQKLSKEAQWHENIDHVKYVIEAKRKFLPSVTLSDGVQKLKTSQAALRAIEKDLVWIQPMLWEIERSFKSLRDKGELTPEGVRACEASLAEAREAWEAFQRHTAATAATIAKMKIFHDFLDEVERLLKVLQELQQQMHQKSETEGVVLQISEHGVLFSELKLRDMTISKLRCRGKELGDQKHPKSNEIKKLVEQLEEATLKTLEAWQKKQDYLLQCFDLERFQKEAKNIEELILELNSKFSSCIVPTTTTESYQMLKEHETLQKKAEAAAKRLVESRRKGIAMAESKHFYADGIKERLQDLEKKLQKMEYDAGVHLKLLKDEDLFIKFREDIAAQSAYLDHCDAIVDLAARRQKSIQQRMARKTTRNNNNSRRVSNASIKKSKDSLISKFVGKMKEAFGDSSSSSSSSDSDEEGEDEAILSEEAKLQQAIARARVKKLAQFKLFLDEFNSRSKIILTLEKQGQDLKPSLPRHCSAIEHLTKELLDHHARLQEALQKHQRALEIEREKENLRAVQRELRAKIREIESSHPEEDLDVQLDELERLKNQLDAIAQKHDDFNAEYEKAALGKLETAVEQLILKDKANAQVFAQKKTRIADRWKTAVNSLMSYRQLVGRKLDVMTFKQERDLLHEELSNVDEQLDSMDPDDELSAILVHLRDIKNISVLRPIVSNRVAENEKRAQVLMNKYPQETKTIGGIIKETLNLHKKLKAKWDSKEKLLQHSHDVLKFEAKLRDLQAWLDESLEQLDDTDLPDTIALCEAALQTHVELKIALSSRDEEISELQVEAKRLISASKSKPFNKKQVQVALDSRATLAKQWTARRRQLEGHLLLLQFRGLEARLKRDLESKEKILEEDVNSESVQAMQNQLRALEAAQLQLAQLDQLQQLQQLVKQLPKELREAEGVKLRVTELSSRRAEVLKQIQQRKEALEAKLSLLDFMAAVDQVLPWMQAQLNVSDEVDCAVSRTRLDVVRARLKDVERMVEDTVRAGEELAKKHLEEDAIHAAVKDMTSTLARLRQRCRDDLARRDRRNKATEYRKKAKEILSWMNRKLKEKDDFEENIEEDLKKIKETIQAYQQLEKDGLVIKTQVDDVERHRQQLQNEYPDIFEEDFSDEGSSSEDEDEVDTATLTDVEAEWNHFMRTVKTKLKFFKNLKSAKEFSEQQESLMEWIRDMEQKMSGYLDQDFVDSNSPALDMETYSRDQDEVVKEVQRRDLEVETLIATWKTPVNDKDFPLRDEVEEKLEELEEEWKALKKKVKDRKKVLNQSMEVKEMIRDLHLLDEFIDKNEEKVQVDEDLEKGSVEQVENELRQLDTLLKQMEHYESSYKAIKEDQTKLPKTNGDELREKEPSKSDRKGSEVKLDFSFSSDDGKVSRTTTAQKQSMPGNENSPPAKLGDLSTSKNGSESEASRSTSTSASKPKKSGALKPSGKKGKKNLADSESDGSYSFGPLRASTPKKKKEEKIKNATTKPPSKKTGDKNAVKASITKKDKDKKTKTSSQEQKKIKKTRPALTKTKSTKKKPKKIEQAEVSSSDDSSSTSDSSDSDASLSEFEEETFV